MNTTPTSSLPLAARIGVVALLLVAAAILLLHRRASPLPSAIAAPSASLASTPPPRPAPASAPASAEARRARDAMREQILDALRKQAASAHPAEAPASPRSATTGREGAPPAGHYEPAYIQQVFHEDMFPLLRKCYEGALARRPTLAGKLVLTFRIIGDPSVGGVVEDAAFAEESDLKDPEMETCVRESTMTLTFDKPPRGGGEVSVKYPVMFSPGDDDEDEGDAAPAKKPGGAKG